MKEPFEFFHNVPTVFFIMYPQKALNIAQFSHKPSKNSQSAQWTHCDQIAGHIVKELKGFFHKIPSGYFVDTLPKNKVGSFKKYPLGFVLGTF